MARRGQNQGENQTVEEGEGTPKKSTKTGDFFKKTKEGSAKRKATGKKRRQNRRVRFVKKRETKQRRATGRTNIKQQMRRKAKTPAKKEEPACGTPRARSQRSRRKKTYKNNVFYGTLEKPQQSATHA